MFMTLSITRFLVALLFVGVGLACWLGAGIADDLAMRHEGLATLQPIEPAPPGRLQGPIERLVTSNQDAAPIVADYWAGRYDAVRSSNAANESDVALMLLAANSAFRKAQREAGGRLPSVEQLDQTLQAYAGVLKNGGFHADAAYNYEYVARLRDRVARSAVPGPTRPGQVPLAAPTPVLRGDDLPAGATIHGRRGTHPPNTRGEEFEVLTPMDYGEREAQPVCGAAPPLAAAGTCRLAATVVVAGASPPARSPAAGASTVDSGA